MNDLGQVTAPRTVRIERMIAAPAARVWGYVTEAEKRRRWLADGEMEPRAGGRVELIWRNWELAPPGDLPPETYAEKKPHSMVGEILEYDPPRRLVFTWPQGESVTEVAIDLESRGEGTLLVLTHSHLGSRAAMVGVSGGWHAHLGHLVAVAEGRETGPFWSLFKSVKAEYEARIPADA